MASSAIPAEHVLELPGGRQLAYADNGYRASKSVILFFVGIMSIGTAPEILDVTEELSAHYIAPTPPGMGDSSSRPDDAPYNVNLCRDITALLDSTHGGVENIDALYVAGGSYGTVAAQVLYGAPYDMFPYGRKIAGCMLAGGFSPFKYHTNHASTLTWMNYFSVGPVSQWLPFRMVPRLVSSAMASKLTNIDDAKVLLGQLLFDKMDDNERQAMNAYLDRKGLERDTIITRMAQSSVASTRNWDGFMEVSDVLHSDWGFEPSKLDAAHQKPMLVVSAEQDELGRGMNKWIVENYANAVEKVIPGGHIAAIFYMDELWEQLVGMVKAYQAEQPGQAGLKP